MSVEDWTTLLVVLGIWTIGIILNFIVTLIVSCLTAPLPAEIQALVANLCNPTTHIQESAKTEKAIAINGYVAKNDE